MKSLSQSTSPLPAAWLEANRESGERRAVLQQPHRQPIASPVSGRVRVGDDLEREAGGPSPRSRASCSCSRLGSARAVTVRPALRGPARGAPQARRAHDQLSVLHTLEAEDVVGEVAQLRVGAPQGLHLEAQPVVEVDVEGRQHARVVARSSSSLSRVLAPPSRRRPACRLPARRDRRAGVSPGASSRRPRSRSRRRPARAAGRPRRPRRLASRPLASAGGAARGGRGHPHPPDTSADAANRARGLVLSRRGLLMFSVWCRDPDRTEDAPMPRSTGRPRATRKPVTRAQVLARLRAICLALPEAQERLSHGEPTWFAGKGKVFAMLDDHHHGAEHISVWLPAGPALRRRSSTPTRSATSARPTSAAAAGWASRSTPGPTGAPSPGSSNRPIGTSPTRASSPGSPRRGPEWHSADRLGAAPRPPGWRRAGDLPCATRRLLSRFTLGWRLVAAVVLGVAVGITAGPRSAALRPLADLLLALLKGLAVPAVVAFVLAGVSAVAPRRLGALGARLVAAFALLSLAALVPRVNALGRPRDPMGPPGGVDSSPYPFALSRVGFTGGLSWLRPTRS